MEKGDVALTRMTEGLTQTSSDGYLSLSGALPPYALRWTRAAGEHGSARRAVWNERLIDSLYKRRGSTGSSIFDTGADFDTRRPKGPRRVLLAGGGKVRSFRASEAAAKRRRSSANAKP